MNRKSSSRYSTNASTAAEIRKNRKKMSAKLVFEANDLKNDPNIGIDGTGRYVCTLCGTKHSTELSYVKHREGRRHLGRISVKDSDGKILRLPSHHTKCLISGSKRGHAIVIEYQFAEETPSYRFVNGLEQSIEDADPDTKYIVFICKPYENIGFKLHKSMDVDTSSIYEDIDFETKVYRLHFYFNHPL